MMPIDSNKGPGGVGIAYGPREVVTKFDRDKSYDDAVFVDSQGGTYGPNGLALGASSLGSPALVGNNVVVDYQDSSYGIMPINEFGNFEATVVNRTGSLASLMSLEGVSGELAISLDTPSIVVYTGESGEAKEIQGFDKSTALGTDSYTIGAGSSTTEGATKSISIGANSRSHLIGEVTLGSAIPGVQRHFIFGSARTVDATNDVITTDGLPSEITNGIKFDRDGIYDIEVVVLARSLGTNNWARFDRRTVLRKVSSSTAISSPSTTPVSDTNSSLTGLDVTLFAISGGSLVVSVTGVAGLTVQWAAYITVNELSITS